MGNWNKRSVCCPRVGTKGFVMYDGKLRECEIVSGAVLIGTDNCSIEHFFDLKIAGVKEITTCGPKRFPHLYDSEEAFRNRDMIKSFKTMPTVVLLEKIFGKCTWSSDHPWAVTRFKQDGTAKRFELDRKVVFDKDGVRLTDMPEFGDYKYPTLESCGVSDRDGVEVVRFKPDVIDFREVS